MSHSCGSASKTGRRPARSGIGRENAHVVHERANVDAINAGERQRGHRGGGAQHGRLAVPRKGGPRWNDCMVKRSAEGDVHCRGRRDVFGRLKEEINLIVSLASRASKGLTDCGAVANKLRREGTVFRIPGNSAPINSTGRYHPTIY